MTLHYDDCGRRQEEIRLSVLAPCFNEGRNIDVLVDRTLDVFSLMGVQAELILVDDGSRDDTWRRIAARANAEPRVRGIQHFSNGGIESAWHTGLTAARGRLVCLIDADLQNRPEDIVRLHDAHALGQADIIQGVRHASATLSRHKVFSRMLNRLLNFAFGTSLRDNKSGFLLGRREVLQAILEHRFRYRYFQSFVGVAACLRGYSIKEVDTAFEPRRAGRSFLPRFPILPSIRIGVELLKFRFEVCLFRGSFVHAHRGENPWGVAEPSFRLAAGES